MTKPQSSCCQHHLPATQQQPGRAKLAWFFALPKKLVLIFLCGYQYLISPLLGQNCRFYPSCSGYAYQAVEIHGIVKGSWLALRRIVRCNPWNHGGVDWVPDSPQAHQAAAEQAQQKNTEQTHSQHSS